MEQLDDGHNSNNQLDKQNRSDQVNNSNKPSRSSNSNLCSFYSNYGFCKFGPNCKFIHRRKYYYYNKPTQRKSKPQKTDASFKLAPKGENSANGTIRESIETTVKNFQKRICRYYKAGHCEKGENCLYSHNLDSSNLKDNVTLPNNKKDHVTNGIKIATSKKKYIPICHFFRRGFCQNGDQCKYYHNPKYQKEHLAISNSNKIDVSDYQDNGNEDIGEQKIPQYATVTSSQSVTIKEKAESLVHSSKILNNHEDSVTVQELKHLNVNVSHDNTVNNQIRVQIPQNSRIFNLTTLSEDGLLHLRNTEITQLKKRFPKITENVSSFTFDFEPTDPDWPFDIRSLHLQVTFPESYPLEVCDITVVSHMNYMSGFLLRHLNQSICDWLSNKHNAAIEQNQVVLLFRPFLKWFDKNLEELFNFGLKKVSEEEEAQNADDESVQAENNFHLSCDKVPENNLSEEELSLSSNIPNAEEHSERERNHSPPRQILQSTNLNNTQMQGSKIIFNGLELVEGVATLSCKKLAISVHCGRCKTSCNKILIPNKNSPMACSKCSKSMECNFNPSIMHQFSNVLGTIYLMECQAVDINLVECAFLVDCLSCAKQVSVDGLHYGQKQKLWCKFCNQKLIMGIESAKFQTSASTTITSNKTVAIKKATKKKDPVLKEGCPLPEYGACKHYKKSYRWLRFPCCGRLYPCDLCHDEKEDDHDMKYASRMICGFCSKEQPYSKEKPCFGCSANMTKKSGPYWEGGQGCRNSVTMSRKDAHKFSGMSKTTSKKSQPTGKKKK